jgi:hypothetical protein
VGKGARGGEHRRARHGRDGGAQWWRRDGSGRRKAPNRAGERNNGKATGRAVADGDRVASPIMGARKALTSGARLLEREREIARERGGVRLTGGAELAAAEGSADAWAMGHLGREGGGRKARAREEVWAGSGPAEGGSFLFFYFLFLISISFNSFSFEQIIS